MKIALAYDRVNKWGGAERVLLALHEIWPKAPLYTSVYNPKTASWAKGLEVIPSSLNKFPLAKTWHEAYACLMPFAFESFAFDDFDVVISVTSESAKGIITKPKTLHLCYCLTPTRYLWSGYQDYFRAPFFKLVSSPLVAYLRKWDQIAAQRPDDYLAISKNVQKRIKNYYQRKATVIYPPVDTERFKPKPSQDFQKYFLVVSRLVPYKRIDIAVKAFNQLGLPLKVVGVGSDLKRLKRMARKNIEFLGRLTDSQLLGYYQDCRALIFPQEEDLGLVPLEVQACGRPVIAYRGGGALESVVEGKTGSFFYPQKSQALIRAVKRFRPEDYDSAWCRQNAIKFGKQIFKQTIKAFIEKKWQKHQKTFTC